MKSFLVGERRVNYTHPPQVRKIPLTTVSNRGVMPSLKPHLKGLKMEYESQLEHKFYLLLDHDPNCYDLQPQPFEITYRTKTGRDATVVPDCWAIFTNGREFLFEIKPEHQLQKLLSDENWQLRTKAVREFCKRRGYTYQVITERKMRCARLNNIKDLLAAAKHYAPANLRKSLGTFDSSLQKFLESPKTFRELAELLETVLPLELDEVISLLKYKIYFGQVTLNWDKPFEEALISRDGDPPISVYELPDVELSEPAPSPVIQTTQESQVILSKTDQQTYTERLEQITSLINTFGKEAKKAEVRNFCEQHDLPFDRTYKYYRIWKREGKEGLIPKQTRNHTKSHLDLRVESLLQEALYAWNHGEWRQIKAAYEEYALKCEKLGLKPASYQTFRIRVGKIPAVEERGKFKPATQTFIKRGLTGTYREGRYAGAVIQMDHTKLDIWVVDAFTKQPLGRPWITLGVDVFSRSIWGFYISLDQPSQESVTQAILNGLIAKEDLYEWLVFREQLLEKGLDPDQFEYRCSGFPAIIQVDNAREFRAKLVKRLCMDLNITLEFRPIKTPEFGGFIESIWDTINDGIRNAALKGRVFSRPKLREPVKRPKFRIPPGYNAKDESALTLDEVRDWLFSYIVISYSSDTKSRQNYSPNDVWVDGLRGDNFQPMGGALRLFEPSEYRQLYYQSKIPTDAILSQKGLRYKNILYTSDWLNEARKQRILKDGQRYDFRVSHLDIRRAWIINPVTNEVETLEAYKYETGDPSIDDRLTEYILRGLGKVAGYRAFCISLKDSKYIRVKLGKTGESDKRLASVMEILSEKLARNAKLNKRERRILESLSKTREGREKLTAAGIIAQFEDGSLPIPPVADIPPEPTGVISEEGESEREAVAKPKIKTTSNWKEAVKQMVFWESEDDEEEENE